jgi:hypothetical protein
LVQIISLLLPDLESLKYIITHYKPVVKGAGQQLLEAVYDLHQQILSSTCNDSIVAYLEFIFDEVDMSTLTTPPPAFKQYRRLFERASRRQRAAANRERRPGVSVTIHTSPLSSAVTAATSNYNDEDEDEQMLDEGNFELTSPGLDNAPSLPNSPLDKIIRLE